MAKVLKAVRQFESSKGKWYISLDTNDGEQNMDSAIASFIGVPLKQYQEELVKNGAVLQTRATDNLTKGEYYFKNKKSAEKMSAYIVEKCKKYSK